MTEIPYFIHTSGHCIWRSIVCPHVSIHP